MGLLFFLYAVSGPGLFLCLMPCSGEEYSYIIRSILAACVMLIYTAVDLLSPLVSR
jgi:hypothetical protein